MESESIVLLIIALFSTVDCQIFNCNGKPFFCTSSTTFLECDVIPGGDFVTQGNVQQNCTSPTICDNNNSFSCEFPAQTTTPAPLTNCNGKSFMCTDSKHFVDCVNTGNNLFLTAGGQIQTCIAGSFCNKTNDLPCVTPNVTTAKPIITTKKANSSITIKPTVKKNTTTTKKSITTKKLTTTKNPTTLSSQCPRSGKFADPTDCHVFYTCVGTQKLKNFCELGTVFDSVTKSCTPDKDACGTSAKSYNCVLNGRFPDPKSCYGYFICQRSGSKFVVVRRNCGDSSSYHSFLRQCKAGNGGCIGRVPIFPNKVNKFGNNN